MMYPNLARVERKRRGLIQKDPSVRPVSDTKRRSVQAPAVSTGFTHVTMLPLGGAESIGRSSYLYLFHRMIGRPFGLLADTGVQPGVKMLPDSYEERMLPAFDLISQKGLQVDAIVITHGHLDHLGAIVFAAMRYPNAPIYMSPETKMFARLQLEEGLRLLQETRDEEVADAWRHIPFPYGRFDLERVLGNVKLIKESVILFGNGLSMRRYVAGHIVGAEMFAFTFDSGGEKKTVLHTGDVSVHDQLLVRGAEIPHLPNAVLVCDATNVGVDYDRTAEKQRLFRRTLEILEGGGQVLFPAFALHRAQELVELFMGEPSLQEYPMHVYGPSLSDFTHIYRGLRPHSKFNQSKMKVHGGRGEGGWASHMRLTIARGEPCIIIASGGMGGGAASACTEELLYHGRPTDGYFSTGYFDPCTISAKMHEAAAEKDPDLRFVFLGHGEHLKKYPVNGLQTEVVHLSGHAYQGELETFWSAVNPSQIICVHNGGGADDYIAAHPTFEGAPLVQATVGTELELV